MLRDRRDEFQPVFYPKSIAVVGAFSPGKAGFMFLSNLVKAKFKGALYAVSTGDREACGLKTYRSVTEIPGPVEFVEICIPAQAVPQLLDECAAKGVKAVEMFTAGYSESGTAEGRRLEAEITRKAKAGGFHIVGPNCIGIYNPAINMPCGPQPYIGATGKVALISQSGGNTARVIKASIARKMGLSKAVSYGNGGDLDSTDYLEYLAGDAETKIIGAYIEGVRDGRRFFRVLREVAARKPTVILKGGKTTAGAIAAASHTGSLATAYTTWRTAVKQAGAIRVENIDEMMDTLIALDRLPPCGKGNIGLVSGLAAGGGGDSVTSSDAFFELGLGIPPFSAGTRQHLAERINWPGVITRNPLDLSGLGGSIDHFEFALQTIKDEPAIDIFIVQLHADDICRIWTVKGLDYMTARVISLAKSQPKPVIAIMPPSLNEMERLNAEARLNEAGIAVYASTERAARALANLCGYYAR